MTRTVDCVKLGTEAPGLPAPPWPGELGKRIFDQVSQAAWQQWLNHQTMLINEYRLPLADPKARDFLAKEMEKYFFGGELAETGYVPPDSSDKNAAD